LTLLSKAIENNIHLCDAVLSGFGTSLELRACAAA